MPPASTKPSLPTAKEIGNAAAIATIDKNQTCQSLLLQTLAYGTDYNVLPRENDDDSLEKRSQEASKVLVEAWKSNSSDTFESTLVDAVWVVESLVSSSDNDASYAALVTIIKDLVAQSENKAVFIQKLQATLDPSLLQKTALLQGGKESMVKRLRKLNTDTFYRQQKFNLLQEESEGYAKLLFLLNNSQQSKNLATLTSECMAAFDLDPNRVLDLILDVLETRIQDKEKSGPLLELIKVFCLPKVPHLIGFKLSNYGSDVPSSLYQTIVLLAQENILDLPLLLPHLPPASLVDEAHKKYKTAHKQYIQSLGRVRLSGGIGNNSMDNKSEAAIEKMQQARVDVSTNAGITLGWELLKNRDWKHALEILGGRTTLSKACTLLPESVGDSVCTLIQTMIAPLVESLAKPPELVKGTTAKTTKQSDVTTTLASLSSFESVVQAISEPLDVIVESGCIDSHPVLYCQLCRLLGALLDNVELTSSAYKLFKDFLLPSLSLFAPNPALSSELWSVLSQVSYSTRYRLYRDWFGGGLEKAGLLSGKKSLKCVQCEMDAGKAARYALKRLSKDNVRDMGRQLSKVTHSNPLVVFTTILNQIESYDNLIEMMVETVRFVTPLSLDVLGYCVLSRLSSGSESDLSRSRLKGDGVNVSQWLASLESFAGAFYKKCPDVEFRGILCYLIRRLKDGSVVELGVLRTLLTTAGGYSFADYTSASALSKIQLEGRSGSQLLKRETFAFGVVEKLNQKSSQRIRSVLQTDGMGVTMLIMLAQVRSRILFHQEGMTSKPIKLIGSLFDMCQVITGLLLEFLTDSTDEEKEVGDKTSIAKYAEFMPTPGELHEQYGLDPASLSMLCRPLIRAAMDDSKKKSGRNKLTKLDMTLRKYRHTEATTRKFLPEAAWSHMTPVLFDLFFSHSTYDIYCPEGCYETEIGRLSKEVERLTQHQKGGAGAAAQKSVLAATAASAGATEREIRRAMAFTRTDEAELERVKHHSSVLSADLVAQKKHCEAVRNKINSKKKELFPSEIDKNEVSRSKAMTFLTHCIYSRCNLSPDDALYCARFAFLLHELETPGFSALLYLDGLIDAVAGTLYCVSEGEAANMALLLWETWKVVSRWRYDEDAFAKEVAGKVGSFMVKDSGSSDGEHAEEIVEVTYEEYKVLYNKWHATIGQAALGCLSSSEYMHNRACLTVLTRVVDVYPTRPVLGQKLMDALAPLQEDSNPLQDIKAMAQSYGFQITKARDDGVWKEEDAAVTKARVEKERAAVAERKKKAVEQLAEMQRESEQITEELGESRTRGRDERWEDRRDGRRRPPSRGAGDARMQSPNLNPSAPVFEPPKGQTMPPNRLGAGDAARDSGRRGRDEPRGRVTERERDRPHGFDERRGERAPPGGPTGDARNQRSTGLEGRWQRSGAPATRDSVAGVKRGRSPGRDAGGPVDGGSRGDRDEHGSSKRPRMERDARDGSGDGWGRGGSPPSHRGFRSAPRGSQALSSQQERGERGERGGGRPERRGAPSRR